MLQSIPVVTIIKAKDDRPGVDTPYGDEPRDWSDSAPSVAKKNPW